MLQNNLSESLNATAMLFLVFRSVCFVADLNYSLELIPPGAAVDSCSDIKGKNALLCHLIFVSNTI